MTKRHYYLGLALGFLLGFGVANVVNAASARRPIGRIP